MKIIREVTSSLKRQKSCESIGAGWRTRAGKAIKIIHLLLSELPNDGSIAFRLLLMQRSLGEVLASQRKMLAREGKPGPAVGDKELGRIYRGQLEKPSNGWRVRPHSASWRGNIARCSASRRPWFVKSINFWAATWMSRR